MWASYRCKLYLANGMYAILRQVAKSKHFEVLSSLLSEFFVAAKVQLRLLFQELLDLTVELFGACAYCRYSRWHCNACYFLH
jgi:hypothetical protein